MCQYTSNTFFQVFEIKFRKNKFCEKHQSETLNLEKLPTFHFCRKRQLLILKYVKKTLQIFFSVKNTTLEFLICTINQLFHNKTFNFLTLYKKHFFAAEICMKHWFKFCTLINTHFIFSVRNASFIKKIVYKWIMKLSRL